MREIDRIILHCSASDWVMQSIEHIRIWHTNPKPQGNGWSKVGYHYFITKQGILQQGLSIDETGIHTRGFNKSSIGICLAGLSGFEPPQFDALYALLALLRRVKGVKAGATLHGHNEFSKTKKCPVFDTEPFKRFWRTAAARPFPPTA